MTDSYTHYFPGLIDAMYMMNKLQERIQFEKKYLMFGLQLPFQDIQYQVHSDRVVVNKYDNSIRDSLNTIYNGYKLNVICHVIDMAW